MRWLLATRSATLGFLDKFAAMEETRRDQLTVPSSIETITSVLGGFERLYPWKENASRFTQFATYRTSKGFWDRLLPKDGPAPDVALKQPTAWGFHDPIGLVGCLVSDV